jgi:DNA polymerase-1
MKTCLIDASPYIFRAHYSMPSSMVDSRGDPVGATYGFAAFLLKLLAQEEPTHLAVAFDGNLTGSFRNALYPAYKANREAPPAELVSQLETCRQLTECLGMASFIDGSYEADDLIGTLAAEAAGTDREVVIVSSDKDLVQLVTADVTLLDFARDIRYSIPEIIEKFGVRPGQMTDLLGLAGDGVDNIPGVRGIGTKTAACLLQAFGDLETLYQRLDELERFPIRGAASVRARLAKGRDLAFLSKQLATVHCQVPLEVSLEDLRYAGADRPRTEALFEPLGFTGFRERITRWQ